MGSKRHAFNAQKFLDSGVANTVMVYRRGQPIFSRGDACSSILYVRKGGVKLSVRPTIGKEVVVAVLGPGEFFGEGALAGQSRRTASATALTASSILALTKGRMIRLLREQPDLADRFIAHMLGANTRLEVDLLDQLFNHDEKRLASALLRLARYGMKDGPVRVLPKVSRHELAHMAGTTRSNVVLFLRKFKRLGFIDGTGGLTIHKSLLNVVLQE